MLKVWGKRRENTLSRGFYKGLNMVPNSKIRPLIYLNGTKALATYKPHKVQGGKGLVLQFCAWILDICPEISLVLLVPFEKKCLRKTYSHF